MLGVGGSAANATHMVNDFRKIAQIETYSPTDNVSELTARVNDEGWDTVFVQWLAGSRLSDRDMIFVLSVGGGDLERNISPNIVRALEYAQEVGATICGIVGRNGGYTARVADACVIVPTVNSTTVTPHAEAFQAVIWHLMVSHPALRAVEMKWESSGRARPDVEAHRMTDSLQPAVFLDRDGVLNQVFVRDGVTHPPSHVGEFALLPGVAGRRAAPARRGLSTCCGDESAGRGARDTDARGRASDPRAHASAAASARCVGLFPRQPRRVRLPQAAARHAAGGGAALAARSAAQLSRRRSLERRDRRAGGRMPDHPRRDAVQRPRAVPTRSLLSAIWPRRRTGFLPLPEGEKSMKLFVDTANLEELEQCLKRGFPSGVTTNPSILSKEQRRDFREHINDMIAVLKKYNSDIPLSVEVFTADPERDAAAGRGVPAVISATIRT